MVKNLPASVGDTRDLDSNPELGRSPGGGNGLPLLYFCLENPKTEEATVHGVAKSQTELSTHAGMHRLIEQSSVLSFFFF